jgi:hypothetical protein
MSAERFFQIHVAGLKFKKDFSSTINISFAKVAISTEFLLATSEIQSSMATFSTNTEYHISVILKFSCIFTKNVLNSSGIL